ncbi:MAG: acyl carrier protein [Bradymonadaceae bacterium]
MESEATSGSRIVEFRQNLERVSSEEETSELFQSFVCETVGDFVGRDPGDLDGAEKAIDYGVDSLMAVEFVNELEQIGIDIPLDPILSETLDDLAELLRKVYEGG